MVRPRPAEPQTRGKKMTVLYAVIAGIHCLLIFVPLWYFEMRQPKQKVNLFRVKIGPAELSSGPRVGPPERARQKAAPPKPQPEPEIAPPPAPEPQFVPPKPKAVPEPVFKPKPKAKPVVKPKAKPKTKPAAKPAPQKNTKKQAKKPLKKTPKKPVKPKRNDDNGVFQSEPAITNPKVPAGNVNRAQTYGKKFDSKAPGGGADADMALYGEKVKKYIHLQWKQPPQSRIGDTRPETVVEFVVSPSGKVLSAKIVTPSRNPAMEESVKALLATLDILPRPPYVPGQKNLEFQLVLKTK